MSDDDEFEAFYKNSPTKGGFCSSKEAMRFGYMAALRESKARITALEAACLKYRQDYLDENADGETDCVTPLDCVLYVGTTALDEVREQDKERIATLEEQIKNLEAELAHERRSNAPAGNRCGWDYEGTGE